MPLLKPSRPLSLRITVILAVLLGLFVPAWFSYQNETSLVEERMNRELLGDVNRYADLLAAGARDPIWQVQPKLIEPMVDAVMSDPRMLRVTIRNHPSGKIFFERSAQSGARQSDILHTEREVRVGSEVVGLLLLDISKASLEVSGQGARRAFLLRTSLSTVVTLLLIFFTLQWRMTAPIDKLVWQSENIAAGRLDEPLAWSRADELGRLGQSLEKTRDALKSLIGELKREIEERKRAEATLESHNERLEASVAERTAELSNALTDLKQAQQELVNSEKLASLGRMVAGIAHELNTPIGNALTIGTALKEQLKTLRAAADANQVRKSFLLEFAAHSQDGFEIMERSLFRAAELIKNFKQVAADQISEQRREFDLAQTLAEITSTLQPRFKNTGVQLRVVAAPGIAMDSYPGMLGQVVSNLVVNALIHAFEGRSGGTVTLEATDQGEQVQLVVRDDGNGVPPEHQGKVFDPFFTTRMGRGGTGLGLNIVHNLVTKRFGGSVQLDAEQPHGARFTVMLPKQVRASTRGRARKVA
jgi:signal transduction histidine kinase